MDRGDVILLGTPLGGPFFNSGGLDFHVLTRVISLLAFIGCRIFWFARSRPFTLKVDDVETGFICQDFCLKIFCDGKARGLSFGFFSPLKNNKTE